MWKLHEKHLTPVSNHVGSSVHSQWKLRIWESLAKILDLHLWFCFGCCSLCLGSWIIYSICGLNHRSVGWRCKSFCQHICLRVSQCPCWACFLTHTALDGVQCRTFLCLGAKWEPNVASVNLASCTTSAHCMRLIVLFLNTQVGETFDFDRAWKLLKVNAFQSKFISWTFAD